MIRNARGSSILEVIIAGTVAVVVLVASVALISRAVAQVGSARTGLAEQPARLKTAATEWVQSEVEYLRSLGFPALSARYFSPATFTPAYTADATAGIVYRDITPGSKAAAEQPLPRGFARARVSIGVESLDGCPSECDVGIVVVGVDLFSLAGDSVPFHSAKTSLVRR
jgi:hypothetical protein